MEHPPTHTYKVCGLSYIGPKGGMSHRDTDGRTQETWIQILTGP